VAVHATLTVADRPDIDPSAYGFEVIELPALNQVASTIHRGTMDNCDTTYQALLEWIERNGYRPLGYSREIDIECGPDRQWITELQIPIEPSVEHRQ
jgi:effector-binding domain-containing protein